MRPGKQISKTIPRKRLESIAESSGDWVACNYWVKIGLTRDVAKALTRLGKHWFVRKSPCAEMARHLVSLAIINEEDTQNKLRAALKYAQAEGFTTFGMYCDGVMRARQAAQSTRMAKKKRAARN
jgi:hypothetical protein